MAQQPDFGGQWTRQKLDALSKYLRAYTRIFSANPRAQFFETTYVDAFAGTGALSAPTLGAFANELIPDLEQRIEEYRKGSVTRALEIDPPFNNYVFIEKDSDKCKELSTLAGKFPDKNVQVVNNDANKALLQWCKNLNTKRSRAVVFVDPFGACVDWDAIAALGQTWAVDLWLLFPYSAVNRMLVRDRKPSVSWANRLTRLFGTDSWEREFYSSHSYQSLLDPTQKIERVYKSADYATISDFFRKRLCTEFVAVSEPLALLNSNGSLLFLLYFAAGNEVSARTGLKIANGIIRN
jgi:three-Cys-motif partner protein